MRRAHHAAELRTAAPRRRLATRSDRRECIPRGGHALREVGGSVLSRDVNAPTTSRPGETRNVPPSVPHRSANSGIVDESMLRVAPSHRDEHASHTATASRLDDQSVQARSATHRPDLRERTENPSRARRPAARSAARSAEPTPWSRHVEHHPASTVVASRASPSTAVVAQRERVENASSTTRGEAPQGANRPTGQGAPRRTSASEDDDGASRPGRESERPLVRLYPLPVSRKLCGCECRASARRLHSPHGFLGGPRFGRGLTGGSDMAQPRSGNECGESGDDGGDHAGGVQPAGERRLRCCSQRRAHRIRQLRVRREDHADGSDGDVHADAVVRTAGVLPEPPTGNRPGCRAPGSRWQPPRRWLPARWPFRPGRGS